MQAETLAGRIQQRLRDEGHGTIVVAERRGVLLLSGRVDTPQARAHVGRIAAEMAAGYQIDNGVLVEPTTSSLAQSDEGRWPDDPDDDALDAGAEDETPASVLEQPLETSAINVENDSIVDDQPSVEDDPAYFAPVDPPVGPDAEGNLEVLGGWDADADADEVVARSAEDNLPGDEALADAIRRELREDSMTTALNVDVEVAQGVAHLQGRVDDLEDAEAAEDVALRVPGVLDVIDDLEITSM
ncbi:MAG: hypothetical protein OJF49_000786 [Ktedonobacterales bacterium]|jgi:osmotically-inducible protein OsmY|nr:MAG: hypothetical protein OJF49_000786 [Ktedonobacterales bacterium]